MPTNNRHDPLDPSRLDSQAILAASTKNRPDLSHVLSETGRPQSALPRTRATKKAGVVSSGHPMQGEVSRNLNRDLEIKHSSYDNQ